MPWSGCDGLQLASYAGLSLDATGIYMRAFGAPAPWPVDVGRDGSDPRAACSGEAPTESGRLK